MVVFSASEVTTLRRYTNLFIIIIIIIIAHFGVMGLSEQCAWHVLSMDLKVLPTADVFGGLSTNGMNQTRLCRRIESLTPENRASGLLIVEFGWLFYIAWVLLGAVSGDLPGYGRWSIDCWQQHAVPYSQADTICA